MTSSCLRVIRKVAILAYQDIFNAQSDRLLFAARQKQGFKMSVFHLSGHLAILYVEAVVTNEASTWTFHFAQYSWAQMMQNVSDLNELNKQNIIV